MFVIHDIEVMLGCDNRDLFLASVDGPYNSFVFDVSKAMVFGTRKEADKMLEHESLQDYRDISVMALSEVKV